MKKIRYLCFTENSIYAITSSSEISASNEQQVAWINRKCNGEVLLIIRLPNSHLDNKDFINLTAQNKKKIPEEGF